MEIAVIYMIAALQFTYSMPEENNFRFDTIRHVDNNLQGSLESVIGVPQSMQKSLTMDDTFFILTDVIVKLDVTGSIAPSTIFGSDTEPIGNGQFIILNNDTQILTVDTVFNVARLITLDSANPLRVLLCNEANCCKINDPTCFESPVEQLGYVAVSPQNPYHLYFVTGSTVQEIDLTSNHPKSKIVFTFNEVPDYSILSLNDDGSVINLVTFHDKTGTYYRLNLTSSNSTTDDPIVFSAPNTRSLLQLSDSNLLVLDDNSSLSHVDIRRNVTSYVCADAELTSENRTFVAQSEACQNPEKYYAITTDGEFVYVLSATGDLYCINYSVDESSSDVEIAELSDETTHLVGVGITNKANDRGILSVETTEASSYEWESILTITLSTVLPVITISIGCYFFITHVIVTMNRSKSKRQTLNMQQEVDPTPIQEDIELVEISSQTRHRSVDLDEIKVEVSPPESTTKPFTNRPLPPQLHVPNHTAPPQLLTSQTNGPRYEATLDDSSNDYEQPMPFINRPLPPIPCHGPSTLNGRIELSDSSRQVTQVAPRAQQVSAPANNYYCDRTLHDVEEQALESPRTLLDPSLLQAVIQSAYQGAPESGSTSFSMTYTPQRIEINMTHQQQARSAPTSVHDYIVINDVPRDSSDV